jgi:hypothetical protein
MPTAPVSLRHPCRQSKERFRSSALLLPDEGRDASWRPQLWESREAIQIELDMGRLARRRRAKRLDEP